MARLRNPFDASTIGSATSVAVIGLGRFGTATALQLARQGREVLGVERDAQLVQKLSGQLTHVVEAEATDIDALRQLGAAEFDSAVVGV
ncbi:NAD-binding protein, partial [Klebsiella pneumoniae]|uniref:NAD-binding protein n=1 Tax=Klebsiella pneumoniae TaxID=573 RepID=UPI003A8B6FEB